MPPLGCAADIPGPGLRVIFFLLRAWAARTPDATAPIAPNMLAYAQSTLAAGFVSVGRDLAVAVRCLLLRSTLPPSESKISASDEVECAKVAAAASNVPFALAPRSFPTGAASFADEPPTPARFSTVPGPAPPTVDEGAGARRVGAWWRWMTRTRERKLYHFAGILLSVAFVFAIAFSLGSGAVYAQGLSADDLAVRTIRLRYALPFFTSIAAPHRSGLVPTAAAGESANESVFSESPLRSR